MSSACADEITEVIKRHYPHYMGDVKENATVLAVLSDLQGGALAVVRLADPQNLDKTLELCNERARRMSLQVHQKVHLMVADTSGQRPS